MIDYKEIDKLIQNFEEHILNRKKRALELSNDSLFADAVERLKREIEIFEMYINDLKDSKKSGIVPDVLRNYKFGKI